MSIKRIALIIFSTFVLTLGFTDQFLWYANVLLLKNKSLSNPTLENGFYFFLLIYVAISMIAWTLILPNHNKVERLWIGGICFPWFTLLIMSFFAGAYPTHDFVATLFSFISVISFFVAAGISMMGITDLEEPKAKKNDG